MLWDPKMHKYAHFAKFGGPINSVVRPQKKTKHQMPNTSVLSKLKLS